MGLSLCRPHSGHHCGCEVTNLAVHGRSCLKVKGATIGMPPWLHHIAMTAASLLAFSVLTRKDQMGLPWYPGSVLSSLSGMPPALTHMPPSYSAIAAAEAGRVANLAEHKTRVKYTHLDHNHIFTPIAIEKSGVIGSDTLKFLKAIAFNRHQESAMHTLICYKGYQLTYNEEMPLLL